ncbi:MAG TPA: non-heme iron oxygenase ferredoxin subunit, partial [Actinomycetes bacterium]
DQGLRVELGDEEAVALIRTDDGGVHAVEDVCSHEDYPLSEGWVEDHTIECALHGSRFDLLTGEPDSPPALRPVRIFPVKVDGTDVLVDLPDDWAKLADDLNT